MDRIAARSASHRTLLASTTACDVGPLLLSGPFIRLPRPVFPGRETSFYHHKWAPSLATTRQRASNAAASSGQARLGRRAPHGQPPYTGDVLPTRQPFHGFADRNKARSLGDHGRIRMWYSAQGFSERCTPLMPRSTPAGRVRGVRPLRMPVDAARGDDLPQMWLPTDVRVVLPAQQLDQCRPSTFLSYRLISL